MLLELGTAATIAGIISGIGELGKLGSKIIDYFKHKKEAASETSAAPQEQGQDASAGIFTANDKLIVSKTNGEIGEVSGNAVDEALKKLVNADIVLGDWLERRREMMNENNAAKDAEYAQSTANNTEREQTGLDDITASNRGLSEVAPNRDLSEAIQGI